MITDFTKVILATNSSFHTVMPFDPNTDRLVPVDLSAANESLSKEIFNDIHLFSAYMDAVRERNGARYAIGGYGEHREVYSFSPVFDAGAMEEEPRRFHLGIDIWGKAGTRVICPLKGIVHSTGYNHARGDYGGTVILAHEVSGIHFHTLYGHLTEAAVNENNAGEIIEPGQVFAAFGLPGENGYWPPHLHFQVILDIGNYVGDYPGVCRFSEREGWLANCPDGDSILCLNRYLPPSG